MRAGDDGLCLDANCWTCLLYIKEQCAMARTKNFDENGKPNVKCFGYTECNKEDYYEV